VARVLIVGGGARGTVLASALSADGHAVRITTRSADRRAAIEQAGAECWLGTPSRLATLRGSLDAVAIACWLLGNACGERDELAALHGSRLELFLEQAIDTTVRGVVYEAAGTVGAGVLADGERRARALAGTNAIPIAVLSADPADSTAWQAEARAAVAGLLGGA
jgi:hypothetical protein